MYIAGLNLSISSPQVLEALVVLDVFDFLRNLRRCIKGVAGYAESKSGPIRAETIPIHAKIVTSIHSLACFVLPTTYIGALALNTFQQPAWMARFALPDEIVGIQLDPMWKCTMRVGACVAGLAIKKLIRSTFHHLGDQWHYIGRRERPRVIQTGPYTRVRHPLYIAIILQDALWAVSFWSYAPLIALGILAVTSAVKVTIEEAVIQKDKDLGEEYRNYQKKVPARFVPYVW